MAGQTVHKRRQYSRTLSLCSAILIMAAGEDSITPAVAGEPAASQTEGDAGAGCASNSKLRYRDNGDGTVRDNRSGLLWLKDANCAALGPSGDGKGTFEEANAAAASLRDGQCGLSDGSKAGDWRLPNKQEWQAMLDSSFKNPAIGNADGTRKWKPGDVFTRVQPEGYWSSTPDSKASGFAWGAGLFGGMVASAKKQIQGFIWPVRNP
jgi:hypothetical protein